MFKHIMERNVTEDASGETLWEQCREELHRINYTGKDVPVEEVDRLAKLVSHQVRGDFTAIIQEITSDTINSFMDDIPF